MSNKMSFFVVAFCVICVLALILLFVAISDFFVCANADTFDSYQIRSNVYTCMIPNYVATSLSSFYNYHSEFYIVFAYDNEPLFKFVDVLNQFTGETSREQILQLRSFSDVSTQESYFEWTTENHSARVFDYVACYEQYTTFNPNDAYYFMPDSVSVSYAPFSSSNINWTLPNHAVSDIVERSCLLSYTWRNSNFALRFELPVVESVAFKTQFMPNDSIYTYTLYNSADFAPDLDSISNNAYFNGYNAGIASFNDTVVIDSASYNAGVSYADNRVSDSSASYIAGFDAGVDSANQYSFMSLFGAVFDAPIKAVSGMLNFDIFGVNMSMFFWSLCSVALVIFVIRLVL